MSLLEIKDLKTYIKLRVGEVRAVDGISFTVEPGETIGLVGESGCGKTMTGMSIMRLLPNGGYIAGGQINFLAGGRGQGDHDTTEHLVDLAAADEATVRSIRGNDIGVIFQDPMTSLNPTMKIGRQIAESVRLHRHVSRAEGLDRAAEVLGLVGMSRPRERLDDYPHQLSGGLRQRVMIAMALACEPKLLIADEPTTALDVTIQAQILSLLDDLREKLGMAMILITHDMGVIAGRADRVIVMYAGQKVEMAETFELFDQMRHPYTEALLASIPQLDQDKSQRLYSIPGLPPDLTNPPVGCRFAARCAYATEECRETPPPLEGAEGTHQFACFHPRQISAAEIVGSGDRIVAAASQNADLAARHGAELRLIVTDSSPVDGAEEEAEASLTALSVDETAGGPTPTPLVLEFVHVSKEFNVTSGGVLQRKVGALQAVSDVSIELTRGETLGLVGESGCGKTTLGRMGVALETPTRGQVLFNGQDLGSLHHGVLRHTRRDLQLMFQDPYASLDPRMRVKEILAEPLVVSGRGDSAWRARTVEASLDEVGLPRRALGRYPHEFSGGQRQRIGLARALVLNPQVIVADEPVSALDVSIRSQILNLMRRIQTDHGLSYLVISHDLSVIRYLADRIGVMYLGKLIEVGTGDDIYERPAHHYTAGLLATIPVPRPSHERHKRGAAIKGELPSPLNPPSGCRFRTRCPRAEERCALEGPQLVSFGGPHQAACHFPLQTPVELTSKAGIG